MKPNPFRFFLFALALLFTLRVAATAAEPIKLPMAQEISTAKVNSAIHSGKIPQSGVLLFVICTDLGDGSPPIVVLDTPQRLTGGKSQQISYDNNDAGTSFKGSVEEMPNHSDQRRLTCAYSVMTGLSDQQTGTTRMECTVRTILTQGTLTLITSGGGSMVDPETGKRTGHSTYIFGYYK